MERGCQSSLGSTSSDFFTFTMAWLHGDGSRDSDLQCDDKIQRSFSTGGLWNVTMDVWHTGVYPMSILPEGILKKIILLNPVTAPMEMFRYYFTGGRNILPVSIGVSLLFTILVMLGGIVVFNKVERTFMDTV